MHEWAWGRVVAEAVANAGNVLLCGTQLGAAIYALRVPERWRPGAFDLWCSSHQLFHLCVVTAALIHYAGVHTLLDWRDATGGCAAL
jgi:adiponectin receptor